MPTNFRDTTLAADLDDQTGCCAQMMDPAEPNRNIRGGHAEAAQFMDAQPER